MYPAAGVGSGLITPDDLPDQIEVGFFSLFEGTRIFDKVGGEYTCDFPNGEARVFVDNDFTVEFIWRFQYLADGQDGILNANRPRCLFQEQESINEEGARDLFADTYTVTTNQATGVVTRRSLCSWTGTDSLGCDLELLYETLLAPPRPGTRFKWTVDFAEGGLTPCAERAIAVKTPHQNTPVGSYDYAGVSVA